MLPSTTALLKAVADRLHMLPNYLPTPSWTGRPLPPPAQRRGWSSTPSGLLRLACEEPADFRARRADSRWSRWFALTGCWRFRRTHMVSVLGRWRSA